jgi:hypothetical protein
LIWRYGDQSNGAGKWVVLLGMAAFVDIDEGLVKILHRKASVREFNSVESRAYPSTNHLFAVCLMEIRMFPILSGFNY